MQSVLTSRSLCDAGRVPPWASRSPAKEAPGSFWHKPGSLRLLSALQHNLPRDQFAYFLLQTSYHMDPDFERQMIQSEGLG